MNISEKIALSSHTNCTSFILEGNFLKVYNQSLYITTQLLNSPLKINVKRIKKLNQLIVYAGFPVSSIEKRFPNAMPTLFGYELNGQFDLSGYSHWYYQCCSRFLTQESHHISELKQILGQ